MDLILNELPKTGNRISWKDSVGYFVKFAYDDIEGEIEILRYFKQGNNHYLTLRYEDNVQNMHTGDFTKGSIGSLIQKTKNNFAYGIGDIIGHVHYGKLKILKQIRIKYKNNTQKGYQYVCLICGNVNIIQEFHLKNKSGCNICCHNPKKVLVGYNDIHTTHPKFCSLLWNYNDGYKYSFGSNKKIDFKCTICGNKVKNKIIRVVLKNGLSCPYCGDGLSYPNRLLYNLMSQIKDQVEESLFEWSPSWAVIKGNKNKKLNGRKKYDWGGVINGFHYVIEMHGNQHYANINRGDRELKDEQENDMLKQQLCESNQCKYISIDCSTSDLNFIKDNILSSNLSKILNLNEVNWYQCDRDSQSSLVITVCDLWNKGTRNTEVIANITKLSRQTVTKYLKKGKELSWCDYDAKIEISKSFERIGKLTGGKNGKSRCKAVVQLSLDDKFISEFESAIEVRKKLKIDDSAISKVCRGGFINKSAGGFKWMYKSDYEKLISTDEVTSRSQ